MRHINFRKAKFSCYALGKIMGVDRDEKISKKEASLLQKLEKKQFNNILLTPEEDEIFSMLSTRHKKSKSTLSKTCISYLREEVFIYLKYGHRIRPGGESSFESNTRIQKGTLVEAMAIAELSKLDGINYRKNEKKHTNSWISGIPDINYKKRLGERKVIDIKSSWDIYTFMANLSNGISLLNKCQIQGYISLTKADVGEVCHILVSAPDELIEKQVNKLRYKNVFATEDEFKLAADETRRSMRFDDIPIENRIIRFPVIRSEKDQKEMFDRVDLCREWLMEYQKKHDNYLKKH